MSISCFADNIHPRRRLGQYIFHDTFGAEYHRQTGRQTDRKFYYKYVSRYVCVLVRTQTGTASLRSVGPTSVRVRDTHFKMSIQLYKQSPITNHRHYLISFERPNQNQDLKNLLLTPRKLLSRYVSSAGTECFTGATGRPVTMMMNFMYDVYKNNTKTITEADTHKLGRPPGESRKELAKSMSHSVRV
jgi:hypothetical protein